MDQYRKPTKGQRVAAGARDNAGALGVGLPVIVVWVLGEYAGIDMPDEVISAVSGIVGVIGGVLGSKLREW
jgi:hypothetical protein